MTNLELEHFKCLIFLSLVHDSDFDCTLKETSASYISAKLGICVPHVSCHTKKMIGKCQGHITGKFCTFKRLFNFQIYCICKLNVWR